MNLKFEEYHDCESVRPLMYRLEIVSETKGVWPFKRTVEREQKVWEERSAEWTCPDCQSKWQYRGTGGWRDYGWWSAVTRTRFFVDQNGRTVGSTLDSR